MLDVSSIFNAVIHGLMQGWYFWLIVLVIIVLKLPTIKGFFGETIVNKLLALKLDKDRYHILKDITLKTTEGTTQIDHVVISKFGIFIIETKNMKGWIFGGEHQKMWTQKIYKHTSKFQNPLYQNYKHKKVIANILNIEDAKIFSIIVFIGNSTFKTDMPNNVIKGNSFINYILSKQTQVFSHEEKNRIIATLSGERLPNTFETHRNHVEHLKSTREKIKQSSDICPRCNGKLVLRTVKRGKNIGNQFYGCSNFPKCRYTRNTNE